MALHRIADLADLPAGTTINILRGPRRDGPWTVLEGLHMEDRWHASHRLKRGGTIKFMPLLPKYEGTYWERTP